MIIRKETRQSRLPNDVRTIWKSNKLHIKSINPKWRYESAHTSTKKCGDDGTVGCGYDGSCGDNVEYLFRSIGFLLYFVFLVFAELFGWAGCALRCCGVPCAADRRGKSLSSRLLRFDCEPLMMRAEQALVRGTRCYRAWCCWPCCFVRLASSSGGAVLCTPMPHAHWHQRFSCWESVRLLAVCSNGQEGYIEI